MERLHPDKPKQPGQPVKREFEYIRHGTLSLTVHREVATGQVVAPFSAPTCEEEDFVLSVVLAISERPEAKRWHFVVDNAKSRFTYAVNSRLKALLGRDLVSQKLHIHLAN